MALNHSIGLLRPGSRGCKAAPQAVACDGIWVNAGSLAAALHDVRHHAVTKRRSAQAALRRHSDEKWSRDELGRDEPSPQRSHGARRRLATIRHRDRLKPPFLVRLRRRSVSTSPSSSNRTSFTRSATSSLRRSAAANPSNSIARSRRSSSEAPSGATMRRRSSTSSAAFWCGAVPFSRRIPARVRLTMPCSVGDSKPASRWATAIAASLRPMVAGRSVSVKSARYAARV